MIDIGRPVPLTRRISSVHRFVLMAATAVILGSALSAHISLASKGDDYSGSLAMLDRIFDASLALILGALAFSVGRFIGRALCIRYAGLAEEVALSVLIGTGTIGLGVLGLGLMGLLRPFPILTLLLVLGVISRAEMSSLRSIVRSSFRVAYATRSHRIVGLLFSVMVLLLALRSLLPPTGYDEAIYHLPVTKSFLEKGRVFPVYNNFSGNLPFLPQMIYAICLAAKSDTSARLFSLMVAVITAVALYAFCARFLNRTIGCISMFAFFGAGMVVEVAVTCRVDVSLAGVLFASTYALMVFLETHEKAWLVGSAILAGFSLGIKYSAMIWIVLMGVVYLFVALRDKSRSIRPLLGQGLIFLAVTFAVASPWYIKNAIWFHNPIYPFVTGEVRDAGGRVSYFTGKDEIRMNSFYSQAASEIPGVVNAQKQHLADMASHRVIRHSLRFWEYFVHPDVYNMAEPYHDPNYLFILAPLFLVFIRHRWLLALAFLSVGFYLLTASTYWIGRYFLPVYPALTILAAAGIVGLTRWLRQRSKIAIILPYIAVGLATGSAVLVSCIRIYDANGYEFLRGAISRRLFILQSAFYYPPLDFINRTLPQEARVMMLGAQMGYGLKRDYLADDWDSTEWRRLLAENDSMEALNQDLKRRGITHILFGNLFGFIAQEGRQGSDGPLGTQFAGLRFLWNHRSDSPDFAAPVDHDQSLDYWGALRTWATFELYQKDYLELIYHDKSDFRIYALK